MAFVCLAYHRISHEPAARSDPYTVTPKGFAEQMCWLARQGLPGVPLSAALAEPERRQVALTFDDGTLDFLETAWPLLRAHGHQATLFVVAGLAGQHSAWPGSNGVSLLDWSQLRGLSAAGIEIGAHGWAHHTLAGLTCDEAATELARCRDQLDEALGPAPRGLAYPYGECSPAVLQAAARTGYAWGCTARGGRNSSSTPRWQLRRTLVCGGDRLLKFALKVRTAYTGWMDWRLDRLGVP